MGRHTGRSILTAGGSIALAGSLFLMGAGGAHALSSCRTDPLVTLSNGAQVRMYEDIYDSATDVTGITYQLHIPVGLTVKYISYDGAVSAGLQKVSITADESAGNYDAYTTVYTRSANVSVTAYMSGTSNGTTSVSCHTDGHAGQQLHSHLHVT